MIDWDKMRSKRDDLLARTDWTQMADSPLSVAQKTAWATYRQALRDLPTTYSEATDKSEVTWPVKPS